MRYLLFVFLVLPYFIIGQTFTNPIIPGGHPDPSICRVDDDFYIVNSTFEYFPALPIYHSKDLVNWELIGYGLHREEQGTGAVNLVDVQQNGGIHAPSIRYHNGLFYIITTNVYSPMDRTKPAEMVNFIITAEHPSGPWSKPHVIEGAPGIDPDIFFDKDGKVWYVGTHAVGQPEVNGIGEIWIQELDLENWKLKGERHSIWRGACGGCCVEGPHIYQEHGRYYLLVAEGGTGLNHAVMMATSDKITGPYESNPRNPILTSRHLSNQNWVHSTGHADLVELPDGRWYMVALGIRNEVDGASNMGRETHLIPVSWEPAIARWEEVRKGVWEPVEYLWPVCAPETGKVEHITTPLPFPDKPQTQNNDFFDDFNTENLHLQWNFRRVPRVKTYSLSDRKDFLRLYLKPEVFKLRDQYSMMGIRQKESEFEYSAKMEFSPQNQQAEAGISIFQQDDNYINFTIIKESAGIVLKVAVKPRKETLKTVKQEVLKNYKGNIVFKLISKNNQYEYLYSLDDGKSFIPFVTTTNDLVICRGYIGTNVGVYATSNGQPTIEYADFDWVQYKDFPKSISQTEAQEYSTINKHFTKSTPETEGLSSEAILSFIERAEKEVDALHSFMIVKNGKNISEGWWSPYSADSPHVMHSLSKSFTSTAIGFLVDEGKISLDDKVLSFFPEYAPEKPSWQQEAMRLRDLLTMNTGHIEEPMVWFSNGDWAKIFMEAEVPLSPGTHFKYNSAATYMLSAILQKVTDEKVVDYLTPRLFEPLQIKKPHWDVSPNGINAGGWGLSIRTEDIAKLGQLYLQKGQWNGVQLLSENWVKMATSKQVSNGSNPDNDWNQGYGFQFWQCRHNAYRGDGAYGQYCIVIPEKEVVIAITSGVNDMGHVMNIVWEELLPALKDNPLPNNPNAHKKLLEKTKNLQLPTIKGLVTSPMAKDVSQKVFQLAENDLGLQSIRLNLYRRPHSIEVVGENGKTVVNIDANKYFKGSLENTDLPGTEGLQNKIAVNGNWISANAYQMRMYFYEMPERITYTFRFEEGRLYWKAQLEHSLLGQEKEVELNSFQVTSTRNE